MNNLPILEFASDRSILIKVGNDISCDSHVNVIKTFHVIYKSKIEAVQSIHPAYNSILITFNESIKSPFDMMEELETLLKDVNQFLNVEPRSLEIPVCYEDEFAPDINNVASHNDLTKEDVIQYHSKQNYLVYFLGFSPGFPYLGGMPKEIATPRLQTPRLKVPEGSVAIGGDQTGIYPVESPGGWRIIGRTPLKLFLPEKNPPTLLKMGDNIKFVQITKEQFNKMSSNAGNKSR